MYFRRRRRRRRPDDVGIRSNRQTLSVSYGTNKTREPLTAAASFCVVSRRGYVCTAPSGCYRPSGFISEGAETGKFIHPASLTVYVCVCVRVSEK